MTPQEFASTYRPQADAVSLGTGITQDALIVQWGVETAWGNAINNVNNLGNIRCGPNDFCQYGSLTDFCAAAIQTWRNGFYTNVLAANGSPLETVLLAIGQSPWDAGHYDNGGGAGSSLIAAAEQLGLLGGLFMALTDQDQQALIWRVAVDGGYANPAIAPADVQPALSLQIPGAGHTVDMLIATQGMVSDLDARLTQIESQISALASWLATKLP